MPLTLTVVELSGTMPVVQSEAVLKSPDRLVRTGPTQLTLDMLTTILYGRETRAWHNANEITR
ncbi:MAG TPA: hypothetical protein VE397_08620 [Stellaceae bacterium]|nr:hypothetical protein [Stellaceae bacterium]